MTRILIVSVIAAMMVAPLGAASTWAGLKTRPYEDAGVQRKADAVDTVSAARELVPLLKGVKQRLRPRLGVGPGSPPDSPFTGTQTTLFSLGIGKKERPIDPKVAAAIDRLTAWKPGPNDDSPEAVLFSHWLEELTAEAVFLGINDCDTTCLISRFTKPDAAFGKSRSEREETRDELLLDALSAAVAETEPR